MKIDKIELYNFGSYSGATLFDISGQDSTKGKVVLIGGKNGAGKTTLFSGLKLCLYGYRALGFQSLNGYYRREVKKFFNDAVKLDPSAISSVSTSLRMSNGQSDDQYIITRRWSVFSDKMEEFEEFAVVKNGINLSEDEIADFDNYLLNLIPPELFDLFFFDGEQIADYFLGENGSETVKNAFMILCGYDVFDIIQKNFKRIAYGKSKTEADGTDYISAKNMVNELREEVRKITDEINLIQSDIDSKKHEIVTLDKTYRRSGGVLRDEWNRKYLALKEEERIREEKNAKLKKLANDVIPFLIVREALNNLQMQIAQEQDKQKLEILQESLKELLPEVLRCVCEKMGRENDDVFSQMVIDEMAKAADQEKISSVSNLLNLSSEEAFSLQGSITKFLSFDKEEVINTEKEIADSIQRSQQLREEIEHSSVEGESDYLSQRSRIEKDIEAHQKKKDELLVNLQNKSELEKEAVLQLKRAEKKLDEELKSKSISDLSQRSVAFLDVLQRRLYKAEIAKVEKSFMKKVKELARKKNFIDKIIIDDSFNVHIYKYVELDIASVCERIQNVGTQRYIEEYGNVHIDSLLSITSCKSLDELCMKQAVAGTKVNVLQEIEKSRLSKGEKQVFIMSLYWALVQLSNHEVPFVIDTPFARIDSEHRANITKKFFMDLKGQVFIFSTNEEIIGENYTAMKNAIQAKFLLENTDNTSTTVIANKYFGE